EGGDLGSSPDRTWPESGFAARGSPERNLLVAVGPPAPTATRVVGCRVADLRASAAGAALAEPRVAMQRVLLATLAITACTTEVDIITDGADSEADADDIARIDELAAQVAGQADAPLPAHADALTVDVDRDGIPDTLEELLLRRYRPYYRFSISG